VCTCIPIHTQVAEHGLSAGDAPAERLIKLALRELAVAANALGPAAPVGDAEVDAAVLAQPIDQLLSKVPACSLRA
jgi:hypothetical protein